MLLANSLIIHENCQDEGKERKTQKKIVKSKNIFIFSRKLQWKV